jgi:probable rRNA maturation factor
VRRYVPDASVQRAVRAARDHGGRPDLAASIVFVTDRALARMHARHLGDASRTDVITFDLSDEASGPLVEVYASAERARSVAARRSVAPRRELLLYVVHGVLHLCGFDDRSGADRARMRLAETAVLSRLGFAVDRAAHDE